MRSLTPHPSFALPYGKHVPAASKEPVDYSYRDEPTYAEAKAKLDELVAANIKAKSKA